MPEDSGAAEPPVSRVLDYSNLRERSSPMLWAVPLLLCVAQFPWSVGWMCAILDRMSGQSIRLGRDTLLYVLTAALTVAAIGTAVFGIVRGGRRGRRGAVILCYSVLGISLFVLAWMMNDWYTEVYLYRNGTWGFW
jgi:hypothetical protein